VWAIKREVVDLMCEMGKANHPHEYGSALRAEGGVITELVLVPGMTGGDRHTFMNTWFLPVDASLVGTVHSHPSPYPVPSDADRQFFSHFGSVHLIIAAPYTARSWRAYDLTALPIELQVVE
jgi:proteasome lid subunit RPN8/RPN11